MSTLDHPQEKNLCPKSSIFIAGLTDVQNNEIMGERKTGNCNGTETAVVCLYENPNDSVGQCIIMSHKITCSRVCRVSCKQHNVTK